MPWSDVVGEILKLINKLFNSPRKQIVKIVNIYDAMHRVLDETPVQRFIIYKAHNGGGVIKPNTPLYISALYEDYTHPFNSVRGDYQKLELDQHALRVIAELPVVKSMELFTDKLPEGMIKSIYTAEGVKHSILFYIGQDKRNFYFCSCASSKDNMKLTPISLFNIQLGVNVIKNNIK